MNCEGVWKVEIGTADGWERIATAFMKNGEYLAASAAHYTVGSYTQDGDDVEISAQVTQYADLRAVFGLKPTSKLSIISRCKISNNEIHGKTWAEDISDHEILIRLTRLDTLE